MSVLYGESRQLPAALFAPNLVKQVIIGVTGECPEQVLYSSSVDILLVFCPDVNINRVEVQMKYQASWMGKPIHLQCTKPSDKDLKQFCVMGSIRPTPTPTPTASSYPRQREGDTSLQLSFFSGSEPPGKDEVTFAQWLSEVEEARLVLPPPFITGFADL